MDVIDGVARSLGLIVGAATWVFLFSIWRKRRKARRELRDALDDNLIHVGTAQDLASAEEALRSCTSGRRSAV